MMYRVDERKSCLIGGCWIRGWVVQMWDGGAWVDVSRAYDSEGMAENVKEILEK